MMTGNSDTAPEAHVIDVDFFDRTGAKRFDIINNDGSIQPIQGRREWYKYTFSVPVYLTEVVIDVQGYESWDKFDLEVEHIDGTKHEEKISPSGNTVSLRLGKLSDSFSFRPPKRWLADTKVLSVKAYGFDLSEFHAFEWSIKEYQEKIEKLVAEEERVKTLVESVADLRTQKSELESEVGKSKGQLSTLKAELESSRQSLSSDKSQLEDIEAKIQTARKTRRDLSESIKEEEAKYYELVREVRLFPSEIVGFVKEGNRSIKWYLGIGFPFLVLLALVVKSLFSSAIDLTQVWRLDEGVDVWTVFLTRLPFVVVALAVIEACSYVVGRLVFEIVRINRQRTEFAKLSIIAKDVSTASADVSELPEEQVFEQETKLKMQLLREHMKSYHGKEFEYKGSALISALVGVAERLSSGRRSDQSGSSPELD